MASLSDMCKCSRSLGSSFEASKSSTDEGEPDEFAMAQSGLLTPLGWGLICGPIVGTLASGNGQRRGMAFLAAAVVCALQALNVFRMNETLKDERKKPFSFSLGQHGRLHLHASFQACPGVQASQTLYTRTYCTRRWSFFATPLTPIGAALQATSTLSPS